MICLRVIISYEGLAVFEDQRYEVRHDTSSVHVHTEYSMLDGASRVEELVDAAVQDNQKALGITDHGNMFGVIEFYHTLKKSDFKPIVGLGASVLEGDFSETRDLSGRNRKNPIVYRNIFITQRSK